MERNRWYELDSGQGGVFLVCLYPGLGLSTFWPIHQQAPDLDQGFGMG